MAIVVNAGNACSFGYIRSVKKSRPHKHRLVAASYLLGKNNQLLIVVQGVIKVVIAHEAELVAALLVAVR